MSTGLHDINLHLINKVTSSKHIKNYQEEKGSNPDQFQEDWSERQEHITKYKWYDKDKVPSMGEEDLYNTLSSLGHADMGRVIYVFEVQTKGSIDSYHLSSSS